MSEHGNSSRSINGLTRTPSTISVLEVKSEPSRFSRMKNGFSSFTDRMPTRKGTTERMGFVSESITKRMPTRKGMSERMGFARESIGKRIPTRKGMSERMGNTKVTRAKGMIGFAVILLIIFIVLVSIGYAQNNDACEGSAYVILPLLALPLALAILTRWDPVKAGSGLPQNVMV